MRKFSISAYIEFSNNDIEGVYNFDSVSPIRDVTSIGAYMLMRSIKTNGFNRNKNGIVNISFSSKDGSIHKLYQMCFENGYVTFIQPNKQPSFYEVDSNIFNNNVINGFKLCLEQGIIF